MYCKLWICRASICTLHISVSSVASGDVSVLIPTMLTCFVLFSPEDNTIINICFMCNIHPNRYFSEHALGPLPLVFFFQGYLQFLFTNDSQKSATQTTDDVECVCLLTCLSYHKQILRQAAFCLLVSCVYKFMSDTVHINMCQWVCPCTITWFL